MRPFADRVERLRTIPGVQRKTAETILAALGPDMSVFPKSVSRTRDNYPLPNTTALPLAAVPIAQWYRERVRRRLVARLETLGYKVSQESPPAPAIRWAW